MRRSGLAALVLVAVGGWCSAAAAQGDKPRFVIILDNSNSMSADSQGRETHGDGSLAQPGCDLNGTSSGGWAYDDSKLYQAKSAIIDTISAFGSAEFALATYARSLLGQPCNSDSDCAAIISGATCVDLPDDSSAQKYCVHKMGQSYTECSGTGCSSCANPSDTNDRIFEWRTLDCGSRTCSYSSSCAGAQVIVGFPGKTPNFNDIYRWIDGKEDLPPFTDQSNREIRADAWTPIAGSISSIRDWLVNSGASSVGPGPGLLSTDPAARDPRASCRSYNIILLTDGEDTCSPDRDNDPVKAAAAAYSAGISVYVVGMVSQSVRLNDIALAGSGNKKAAYFPTTRADLAAALGDIVMGSIPVPRCDCDVSCHSDVTAFPLKGQPCSVGVGRCKREGVYACNSTGDGLVCATAPGCGVPAVVKGAPVAEVCGAAPGCGAPTPADCADDNCDGQADEGMSCECAYKPEVCNGIDDNCNGTVDDIPGGTCGVDIGECKHGNLGCVDDGNGGKTMACQGAVGPQTEICDNKDNDCDGVVDGIAQECYPTGSLGCAYDQSSGKWACAGTCQTGLQSCIVGNWQTCTGAVTPQEEILCDGFDNNCDGQVDEIPGSLTCYPPGTPGCDLSTGMCIGGCSFGQRACVGNPVTGRIEEVCLGVATPAAELCNGVDDDCDGQVDEDFPLLGQPCNEQSCQGAGKYICSPLATEVICSVSSDGPSPEICDGLDNDCDGQVDEADDGMRGVGVPCGSSVGECRAGETKCVGARIVCSAAGPQPEICNGKDDDCNGSIDDSLVPPADKCNPPGMAPGAALVGECRAGAFVCRGDDDGWKCVGGVGPVAEVCDGKDNDCDGNIDNGASCPGASSCVNGECVPVCRGDELTCPVDRYCVNGLCLLKACALNPCPAGQLCNSEGKCKSPCEGVTCPDGATCSNGVCRDCYTLGCPDGQICHDRHCEPDPCQGVACAIGQYCLEGRCVGSCATVICPAGQGCRLGQCVPDICGGVGCELGQFCDPGTGQCKYRPCSGLSCPAGTVCVEADAKCESNPCEVIRCQGQEVCKVQPDGRAECELPPTAPQGVIKLQPVGRGYFGCSTVPGATATAPVAMGLLLGLLAWLRARARRR